MPGIKRLKDNFHSIGIIDSEDFGRTRKAPQYCTRCLEWGMRERLGPRLYPVDSKVSQAEKDNWLQCSNCGKVYAKYEVKQEGQLEPIKEAIQNPFDLEKDQIQGVGQSRRFDRSGITQARKKKKQDLSEVKDPELRREIAQGSELLEYHEF